MPASQTIADLCLPLSVSPLPSAAGQDSSKGKAPQNATTTAWPRKSVAQRFFAALWVLAFHSYRVPARIQKDKKGRLGFLISFHFHSFVAENNISGDEECEENQFENESGKYNHYYTHAVDRSATKEEDGEMDDLLQSYEVTAST